MPKIRYSNKYKKDGSLNLTKSGVLSKSTRNLVENYYNNYSYFEPEWLHKSEGKDESFKFFNDNDTIVFKNKSVSTFLGIEKKYENKTLVYNTPNIIDTTIYSVKNPTSKQYTDFLDFNYYEDKKEIFNDSIENKKVKDESINFDLNFSEDCILSFSHINSSNNPSTIEAVIFGRWDFDKEEVQFTTQEQPTSLFSRNLFTSYFNFKNHNWEYLLGNWDPFSAPLNMNAADNVFGHNAGQQFYRNDPLLADNIDNFMYAPIAFSGFNTKSDEYYGNSQISYLKINQSIPIDTFGFPFDKKYSARPQQTISMKKYIKKPFLLEKIKIEGIFSNRSESPFQTDPVEFNKICMNFVNFFILNQRKGFNKNNYPVLNAGGIYKQEKNKLVAGGTVQVLNNFPTYENIKNKFQISNDLSDQHSLLIEEIDDSQRDLITNVTLCNICTGSFNINPDFTNVLQKSDYVVEASHTSGFENLSAKCNYTRKKIIIEKNISQTKSQKNVSRMTINNYYVSQNAGTRTGFDIPTGRSVYNEKLFNKADGESTDQYNININEYNDAYYENSYLLYPEDNLVLGVSFSPTFDIEQNSIHGKDFFIIHDNLKVTLYGKYLENDKKVLTKNTKKDFINRKIKKIGIENKVIDNEIYFEHPTLLSGSYFDRSRGFFETGQNGLGFIRKGEVFGLDNFLRLLSKREDHNDFFNPNNDFYEMFGYKALFNESFHPETEEGKTTYSNRANNSVYINDPSAQYRGQNKIKASTFSYYSQSNTTQKILNKKFMQYNMPNQYNRKFFSIRRFGNFFDNSLGSTYHAYENVDRFYIFEEDKLKNENDLLYDQESNKTFNVRKLFYKDKTINLLKEENALGYITIDFSGLNDFNNVGDNFLNSEIIKGTLMPTGSFGQPGYFYFSIKDFQDNEISFHLGTYNLATTEEGVKNFNRHNITFFPDKIVKQCTILQEYLDYFDYTSNGYTGNSSNLLEAKDFGGRSTLFSY